MTADEEFREAVRIGCRLSQAGVDANDPKVRQYIQRQQRRIARGWPPEVIPFIPEAHAQGGD